MGTCALAFAYVCACMYTTVSTFAFPRLVYCTNRPNWFRPISSIEANTSLYERPRQTDSNRAHCSEAGKALIHFYKIYFFYSTYRSRY